MKFILVGTDFHLGKKEGGVSNDIATPYAIMEFDTFEQAVGEANKKNWTYANFNEPNIIAFKVQTIIPYETFFNHLSEYK